MRLHQLSVTAFGPFAGTEHVDFDDLNDAGLFLLTGPTGAGKTSILDAVCFALYGSVPGVRGVKTLKSQHADVDVAPEVVLDFSIRDRRFVVRRTPEWLRPKKKGTGLLAEKASATLVETTGGSDHFLSSRAQEVGHLIGELVGMNASQFVQVAMLPQGDFQKFLRASSDERHGVLQHLFKTDRFTRIEDWVNDHSRRLRERSVTGQATVQRILDTVADRAGAVLPDELAGDALPTAASEERLLPWVDDLTRRAEDAFSAAGARRDQAAAAVAERRHALDAGEQLRALLDRHAQATRALAALETSADDTDAARAALERHAAAAPCLPLLRLVDDATARHATAAADREAALRDLGRATLDQLSRQTPHADQGDQGDAAAFAALAEDLRARATRLEALLPRERERDEARAALRRAQTALATHRHDLAAVTGRRAALPGEIVALREQRDQATSSAGRHDALTQALATAREALDAARQVPPLTERLTVLRDAERDARDRVADAREHVQDLVDRRLAGIAAELAGRLEDGAPCQVCGSVDHPHPAAPRADAVTEAEQERANAAYDRRTDEFAAATRAVADAERHLDALRHTAGGQDVAAAEQQVTGLETAVDAAVLAAAERERLDTEIAGLVAEQAGLDARAAELATGVATLEQAIRAHTETIDRVGAEIAAAVGEVTHPDAPLAPEVAVADALAQCRRAVATVTRVVSALAAAEDAAGRVEELTARALATAAEHGLDDLDTVRAAALDESRRLRLESLLAERADAVSRARAVLEDPEVQAVADRPAPDLPALTAALAEAERADAEATRVHLAAESVVDALRQHRARLVEALEEWAPVREEFVRADSMSRLVRGMGGDNQLQMRLSAYVLATRLDQVVAAANERLAHMRDQRYLLQRTGRAARKGSQAGLGLEMVDQWTGDVRDPATLSGGETFVVSLSLALGLADVVTHESGGTEIETLFVDEGFGTLDADTLDDVMDRLDGLRAGGRTVGVVSHVSELRNRIPTQVHVDKRRTGSRIAVRTLAG